MLDKNLLLKPEPDWSSLNVDSFIDPAIRTKYWPKIAKGLICKQIEDLFPEETKHCRKTAKIVGFEVPIIFIMSEKRSDVHTLDTMKFDEGTIEGNFEVMTDIICRQLGLKLEDLVDKVIWIAGDQLTCIRIEGGKILRIRDVDYLQRSEERRVGKECRSRWSPYH